MARLSVVIPTLGRSTLERTLLSCADADEIVVVLDTARGGSLPSRLPPNAVFSAGEFGVTGGHAGRVHGIGLATGTSSGVHGRRRRVHPRGYRNHA